MYVLLTAFLFLKRILFVSLLYIIGKNSIVIELSVIVRNKFATMQRSDHTK